MKRFLALIFTAVLVCSMNSSADLITINAPGAGDLGDLDHYKAYMWRINLAGHAIPIDNEITGVTIKIEDIYDWQVEPNILHINMLDQKTPYTKSDLVVVASDNQDVPDYFSKVRSTVAGRTGYSAASLVNTWKDADGPKTKNDLAFNVDVDKFSAYSGDNNWIGFGFDPDCHFFNSGVRLEITTEKHSVPEPSIITLLGLGLVGLLSVRRKKA